ncbi:ClbS/DfsB family four-helix bundle protein [Pseudomonas sp. NBRC 111119]|uniref:ClbS/DfsB family four-helix bundle protein n=1 Tax=Pseudomonas sp. NBRC 111119 TaxID=1661034 RepID=UPI000761B803|nr:ClbS/DfsB family four-helix bundle protein [Pseudomonas sp. NBRC 111119]
MAIPQNKQQLIEAIRLNYSRLEADLADIPIARTREASLAGHAQGTSMSLSDLLAYLVGWNRLVIKWCNAKARGLPVDFPETGYKWNELGRLAQRFYTEGAGLTFIQLREQLAGVNAEILALLEHETDDSLYGRPWYERYSKGRMIQLNTASPYANARKRVRQWKKALGAEPTSLRVR